MSQVRKFSNWINGDVLYLNTTSWILSRSYFISVGRKQSATMDPHQTIFVLFWLAYSVSAAVHRIPVTAQEVTTANIYFSDDVRTMIPHPAKQGVLVITNSYAVWTLDLQNLNKTLIAGSSGNISGYMEGFGSSARFKYLYGSAEFNQSTILVVDKDNHCVRNVSLISGSTQRYAGVCQSSGSTDGFRMSAKFYHPQDIIRVGSTFYISSDGNNSIIRKLLGNYVSTYKSLTYLPLGLTWNGESFLYSFFNGVAYSDNTVITGSTIRETSFGFIDGSLSSARFSGPLDILAITNQVFLVTDYDNEAVRFADLSKKTVSTLSINTTRWTNPYSLMILNGDVYVGTEYGRIFKFALNQLPDMSYVECPDDMNLTITAVTESVKITLPKPRVSCDWSNFSCVECPSSAVLQEGRNVFQFSYISRITQKNLQCTYHINVVKEQADRSYLECPADLSVALPVTVDYLNVTLQQPHTMLDWSNLSCVECPSSAALREGEHEIKFSYRNLITNRGSNCSYWINVMKEISPLCANQTEHVYLSADQKVSDKITIKGIEISLSPGTHNFGLEDNCIHTYHVHEWSRMNRSAQFQALYNITCNCSVLSTTAFSIIDSTLLLQTVILKTLCEGCKITQTSPDIKCLNDSLIATWKSDVTGNQTDRVEDMEQNLQSSIAQFQSQYSFLAITVFNGTLLNPVKDENGLNLKVLIKTTCLDEGLIYNPNTDICEKTPCD